MEELLKWSIMNMTKNEDAPARPANSEPPKKLDPKIIDHIIGKPVSQQMKECMDIIDGTNSTEGGENPQPTLKDKEIAFDDLEMFVENIDNASNLEPLELWPRIIKQLVSPEPSLRSAAAWVCGTAVQHNPNAQKAFKKHHGLKPILNVLENDSNTEAKSKAMYCLSSYVRTNPDGFNEFIGDKNEEGARGLVILKKNLSNFTRKYRSLRIKTLFLLQALIEESEDEALKPEERIRPDFAELVAKAGFMDCICQFVNTVSASDEPNSEIEIDPDYAEKALRLVALLCTREDTKSIVTSVNELPKAVEYLEKQFPETDLSDDEEKALEILF
ncbi:hsp70 nucleotide exchange factor fes1 [Mycoemilia scoparia]|uniref:Hsp70 nucleotide exchange factor fes1 n=1 Tax=Mycoemilia scoparia TaxID=417184 RepID=A0A9W8DPI9_9FUNG|nr:hsp70 nucleotide exchange factor fes1 [Mycoemilia scoparia]